MHSILYVLLTVWLCAAAQAATVYHVLGIGQSLALGNSGCPALSTTQPYSNLMLVSNISGALTGLLESYQNGGVCATTPVETPNSGIANTLTLLSPGRISLVSRNAKGGTAYAGIKKGTQTYTDAMTAIDNAKIGVNGVGNVYVCSALANQHGEEDYSIHTTAATYEADLVEWQADFQGDCIVKSGQAVGMPMFLTQMHSWTVYPSGTCPTIDGTCGATPSSPIAQWWAARDYPSTHFLVGPKYQFAYASDGIHLTNAGYLSLGELTAKAMYKVLVMGQAWKPLGPRRIMLGAGNTMTVQMWSDYSLTFDTSTVSDVGNCKGFEVYLTTTATKRTCNSATISGDTITLTLAATPLSTDQVAYAYSGTSGQGGGQAGGPHGNLRNTDPTVGQSGGTMYDWAITFREAVGFAWPVRASVSGPVTMRGTAVVH